MESDVAVNRLKSQIREHVRGDRAPGKEVLSQAAGEIHLRARRLPVDEDGSSVIESAISESDHGILVPLLDEIADILGSPAECP